MNQQLEQFQKRHAAPTQQTQIEQSRAVAEVQAAVVVAQQNPRDMMRARANMRESCSKLALANKAFWRVPNRGEGSSVHLARELASCFGNMQFGVVELRRDDEQGYSEIQAFAWDVENNIRHVRSFQVPHARMARKERQKLTDLGDIYNNNQNQGAKALREVIFAVLPTWYIDEAEQLCRKTLENGEGVPLAQRVEQAIGAFAGIGVNQAALEKRVGKARAKWEAQDVASLSVAFQSIRNGEMRVEDEFDTGTQAAATGDLTARVNRATEEVIEEQA